MNDLSCDVLVAGGGVAGTAAAIAAARSGADTILVESESYLGGIGCAGMFQYICGLYLNGKDFPLETLNTGFVRELETLLKKSAPVPSVRKIGQVFVLPYSSKTLSNSLAGLCAAEKRIILLLQHAAVEVNADDQRIKAVTVRGSDRTMVVNARAVVDCTGEGTIAAVAGADFELAPPRERQLAGFVIHIKGLKNADETLSVKVPYHLAQAVQQKKLSPLSRFTVFTLGTTPEEGYCKLSLESGGDSERTEWAKKEASALIAYLASVLPPFKNASIAETSPKILEREGRRIQGDYILTEEDVLTAKKFTDGVVKNAWPIEEWTSERGTAYRYVPQGDYYEIPFRCLTVKGFKNLLCAGRCISVSHAAFGSTRVMGTCIALGEQAGTAAAYFSKNGRYPVSTR